MQSDQWERVRKLFHDALEIAPEQRAAFLATVCDDPEIRAEVQSLLGGVETSSEVIDSPAVGGLRQAIEAAMGADRPAPAARQDNAAVDAISEEGEAGTQRFDSVEAALEGFERSASLFTPGLLLKGRYRLERRLGQGGFGRVFLARDEQLHSRPVVVKVLREEHSSDAWFEKRFSDEIRALAAIDHPGVIAVLDSGRAENGTVYLVMQYAEGVTLRSLIGSGAIPFERVAGLVKQISQALSAAHEKGIVHNDLKPDNIMVQKFEGNEDRVRLIDFGIARLRSENPDGSSPDIEHSRIAGSPSYMAPETLRGQGSAASDIYSLGVVAYELLTGRKPFDTRNAVQLYRMQSAGEYTKPRAVRPDLPEPAEDALIKALAFEPSQRYKSAREFADELGRTLEAARVAEVPHEAEPAVVSTDPSQSFAYDIFVSHAWRDRDVAVRLTSALESRGARCFLAPRDIPAGELFPAAIQAAIGGSRCCLFLVTENANASVQVAREAGSAIGGGTPVLALRVDSVSAARDLSSLLTNARTVECSSAVSARDVHTLETALRAYVPRFGEARRPTEPIEIPPAAEANEPLFSEFGVIPAFFRPGLRRVRLMAITVVWTLITCVLSVLANTAYITVLLRGPKSEAVTVRFGYLYEMNGAFAYLFVVPWFIYFAVGFVLEAQVALGNLADRDQIVVNCVNLPLGIIARLLKKVRRTRSDTRTEPDAARAAAVWKTPLELVGEAHRRWLRPRMAISAFLACVIIIGTEYLPPKSDYRHVMFGYVQAPWIAGYPKDCPNCTLLELQQRLQRRIEPVGRLTPEQLVAYRLVEPYYTRDHSVLGWVEYALFMTSVLGLEVFFGTFILWTVMNAFFFLRLIYRAIIPAPSSVIALHLLFTDPDRMFGLDSIHRALRQLVAVVCVSAILPVLAWWTNVVKGSRRALNQDLYSLAGWGQFMISNGSFVMAVAVLIYVTYIASIARESANEENKRIMQLRRHGPAAAGLERMIAIIGNQSVWSNLRYSLPYAFAPVVCVAAVIVLNKVSIAYVAAGVWEVFLSYILGTA